MTTPSRKRRAARSREEWRTIVDAWQSGGRTSSSVCEQHGVGRASLYAWAAKFRGDEMAPPRSVSEPRFVDVKVASPHTAASPTGAGESCIELVMSSGRIIRVIGDVDAVALATVLKVADQC